ncbi:hypothetical protein K525DRAFT_274998 [Schizophyllum commune Loenen D]|nr:hypothetical protein K525DRAFT_274998 [Schizophyllum commune Loenen D]
MAVRMLQIGGDPVVEIRDKAASALVPTLAYPEPISPRLFVKFFVIQRPFSPSAVILLEGTVSQHPLSPAYASPISMTVFTPQSVSQADVVETIQAIWSTGSLSKVPIVQALKMDGQTPAKAKVPLPCKAHRSGQGQLQGSAPPRAQASSQPVPAVQSHASAPATAPMDLKFMKPLTPEDQESLAAAQDKGKGKGKARYSSPGLPPSPPAVVAGDIKVEEQDSKANVPSISDSRGLYFCICIYFCIYRG